MTDSRARWSIATNIATGTGNTTLKAGTSGKKLFVNRLCLTITTAAAQAFDIEDTTGTVELFKAPASLATATPIQFDYGEVGIGLTTGDGLVYTATAGVALTISAHGYQAD